MTGRDQQGHIRSFHPRRGRLSPTAAEALDRLWPSYGIDVPGSALDLHATFGLDDVVLEIGSGMGDAVLESATNEPDVGILAIDVHTPGLGVLLREVGELGLTNVRVAKGDAVELVRDILAPASLAGVRIFFPDPWPKAKHHKRRLVQPAFVALLTSRLRPDGWVHCATDWAPYAVQMLDVLGSEPGLHNEYDGYAPRPADRPLTRFERAGLAKGHEVFDLVFTRV